MRKKPDPALRAKYNRTYRERHAESLREKRIAKYHDDIDASRERLRQKRNKDRDAINAKRREWRMAKAESDPQWEENERAKARERMAKIQNRSERWREWSAARPAVIKAARERYYGRKANAEGCLSVSDIEHLYSKWIACEYCHRTFSRRLVPTIEHTIPLSRGGTNTIDNVTLACRECNSRKGRLTGSEFRTLLTTGVRPRVPRSRH